MRAIELNGVQVDNNKAAFEWGRRCAHDLAAVQADNEALRAELRHATAAAEESVTALADAVREIDGLRQVAGTASKPWWHPVRGRGRTGL